jgi:hypothetical protein
MFGLKIITMRDAACATILFGFAIIGMGQNSSPPETARTHFQWSESNAHELDYNKTVRTSKELTSAKKELLIKAIAAQIRPFKDEYGIESESELQQAVVATRIKLIDLNNDGISEVLAQAYGMRAGCGATGNCSFWVFQETPEGFTKILDTRNRDGNGGIEVITISPNRTEGFNDIILGDHSNASERTLYVYRYHHGQYKESECYDAAWVSHKDGKRRELRNPEITPFTCMGEKLQ